MKMPAERSTEEKHWHAKGYSDRKGHRISWQIPKQFKGAYDDGYALAEIENLRLHGHAEGPKYSPAHKVR